MLLHNVDIKYEITTRTTRRERDNMEEGKAITEMENFFIDIENSTCHFDGIYLDIMNFLTNFPDIEQVDKLPPHRFREAIQIILFTSNSWA